MAFEMKHSETAEEAIQRIATEQLDDALKLLRKRKGGRVETVHEVRKDFKKVRAVLRLARAGMAAGTYRFENEFFRDLGHQLSDARDAQILIEAFDKLRDDGAFEGFKHAQHIRTKLVEQRD